MEKNTSYLHYNTNIGNNKLQRDSMLLMENGSIDNNKSITMYNFKDIRISAETKTYSKPSIRPKTAGEVMKQTTTVKGVFVRKSFSLSNIEDFFLKRRIPLIKPLISEREIIKIQLLQEQCRKKGIESERRSLQKLYIENADLNSEEEESKDKTRDDATQLISSKVKSREGDTRDKRHESEESKISKTPVSGKKSGGEAKKVIKDLPINKLKSAPKKGGKKEEQGVSDKDKAKNKTDLEDENKYSKSKAKTSSKSEIGKKKSDTKIKNQTKNKGKSENSEGTLSGEEIRKDNKKIDKKQTSKERIKSVSSDKDSPSKVVSEISKDDSSKSKKSNKSDKTESSKTLDSSKEVKKKDDKDQKEKNQLGKMKTQFDKLKKDKDNAIEAGSEKTDRTKGANKTKPGTTEQTSDLLNKEKPLKISTGKKSVKFPNLIQHIIHYVLSNPMFIKLGWTLSPDRAQLQVVTFKAVPATPNTYCFRERDEDEIKYYSKSLEKLAYHFKSDGVGILFYPSSVPAATVTKHKAGMRLTLYSDPKNDPLIRDSFNSKVLGIFDSSGNGVVYDMEGTKVLNFNQLEGIFWSPQRKSPYKWQWCDYKILEKQQSKALLRYMAKEQKQPVPVKKDITLKKAKSDEKKLEVDEAYEQILAELPYPIEQKMKTKSERQFWGFKPITLKINSEMTLRINGQEDVVINFSSNKVFHRIDLGVKIDPYVVERIEQLAPKSVAVSEIPCVFDALLDISPSIKHLTPKKHQYST